jgi:carboxypeptidase PM20D1
MSGRFHLAGVFTASVTLVLLTGAAPGVAETPQERLATALKLETVSYEDPAQFDGEPFLAFHRFVEGAYPALHAKLERETVNTYSLLYTWQGRNPELAPILLTSHIDVVPVASDADGAWEQPPFGGDIEGGYVWGRGAIDNKSGVMATLEAVEGLAAAGFVPERTVYLAFGHDEELGGDEGAGGITALLASRGVSLWFSLDEGMAVVEGMAGLKQPVAMIGVAEKGFLTLQLTARAKGGHSSVPSPGGAIPRLARALVRLDEEPLPARMDGPALDTFDALAPELPTMQRIAIEQRWLFGPILESSLAADPTSAALIRTTTAITMIDGGVKANILPQSASALVNLRIVPGDTVESVTAEVERIVDDPEIEITVVTAQEPSGVADAGSEAFATLRDAINETLPGVAGVAPALVLGGTDSKHYSQIAENSYRFAPMRMGADDRSRFHGTNERIGVENYGEMIAFYGELVQRAAGPGDR